MEEDTFLSIFFIYSLRFFQFLFSRLLLLLHTNEGLMYQTRGGCWWGGEERREASVQPSAALGRQRESGCGDVVEMLQETCGCLLGGGGGGEHQEPPFRDHCSRVREVQSGRPTTQEPRGGCCRSGITSAQGLSEVRLISEITNLLTWKKLKP